MSKGNLADEEDENEDEEEEKEFNMDLDGAKKEIKNEVVNYD